MIWKSDALNRGAGSVLLGAILLLGGAAVATAQGKGKGSAKVSPPGGRHEIARPLERPAKPETPMRPSPLPKPNNPLKAKLAKPVPKDRHREHKRCVKNCRRAHKDLIRACRGRTGADRAACERAANGAHRRCVQRCPR
jgi:hypothetical protein